MVGYSAKQVGGFKPFYLRKQSLVPNGGKQGLIVILDEVDSAFIMSK